MKGRQYGRDCLSEQRISENVFRSIFNLRFGWAPLLGLYSTDATCRSGKEERKATFIKYLLYASHHFEKYGFLFPSYKGETEIQVSSLVVTQLTYFSYNFLQCLQIFLQSSV